MLNDGATGGGRTGGAAAPPDPLGASHPALANPAQANRAPGFAVLASAARPHSAAFGGVRGFSSYPVECAFCLPVRSRSLGGQERGVQGGAKLPPPIGGRAVAGVRAFSEANKPDVTPKQLKELLRCGIGG